MMVVGIVLIALGLFILASASGLLLRLLAVFPLIGGATTLIEALPFSVSGSITSLIITLLVALWGVGVAKSEGVLATVIGAVIVIVAVLALMNILGTPDMPLVEDAFGDAVEWLRRIWRNAEAAF